MPSLIDEMDETFEYDGGRVQGIWADFDQNQDAGQAGMITRVARILISDEDAEVINVKFAAMNSTLTRLKTGEQYEVKNPRRSGVGVTELDLHRIDGNKLERSF